MTLIRERRDMSPIARLALYFRSKRALARHVRGLKSTLALADRTIVWQKKERDIVEKTLMELRADAAATLSEALDVLDAGGRVSKARKAEIVANIRLLMPRVLPRAVAPDVQRTVEQMQSALAEQLGDLLQSPAIEEPVREILTRAKEAA